uniref:Uncharacterized protein n=1 Tax=Plectus sambesii TaxID=2011161 RepID=A0A914X9M6_9BILA
MLGEEELDHAEAATTIEDLVLLDRQNGSKWLLTFGSLNAALNPNKLFAFPLIPAAKIDRRVFAIPPVDRNKKLSRHEWAPRSVVCDRKLSRSFRRSDAVHVTSDHIS